MILPFFLPIVFIGCAISSDGSDEDPMGAWNDLADELKTRP
jgi:hypothetical protein